MIYFIEAEPGGAIKIGHSGNLTSRLYQLRSQCGPGFRVLAITTGGRKEEASLHQHYADLRIKGEWFRPGSDLLYRIEMLRLASEAVGIWVGKPREMRPTERWIGHHVKRTWPRLNGVDSA